MPRVAITGAAGRLGRHLVDAFDGAGHEVRGFTRDELDVADGSGAEALLAWHPDVVVNSAAWTDVDGCARDPDRAQRVNGAAAGRIAELAASIDALVVQISTNEVFDGSSDVPYRPADAPNPISAYGRSKLAGERAVAAVTARHVIVRTAWLFGPRGSNFVTKVLAAAERTRTSGEPLRLVADEVGNPTWAPDLARAIVSLVAGGDTTGIVHAAGTPPVSRLEWGRAALEAAGIDVPIEAVPLAAFERASTPPPRAVLENSAAVPEMAWLPATRAYAASLGEVRA